MSTRTLLELLAGKMPIDEFTKSYSPDARTTINPFMQRLQIGQLITAVSVQRICWMAMTSPVKNYKLPPTPELLMEFANSWSQVPIQQGA
jgi:hypothetical protein